MKSTIVSNIVIAFSSQLAAAAGHVELSSWLGAVAVFETGDYVYHDTVGEEDSQPFCWFENVPTDDAKEREKRVEEVAEFINKARPDQDPHDGGEEQRGAEH